MANRFKERLAAQEQELDVFEDIQVENLNSSSNENMESKENVYADLLESIKVKGKRGGGENLYLSQETRKALEKVARQKGISKSKLADIILRKVLIGDE